ncbi:MULTISPECIES: uroporphyrinogen-III synthase [unclassified Acinetobacter]|uniref:uroporphyrinogen-III synthase n=1 Tax=unclassified Acinetobacter TaxID=196816 RepID=UPI00190DD68D|nr:MULTISPECIES: uroporphyrinogen-III synthase [unclassified Acinetobacter]MBK0064725.1 uroporphyrinogen-III synthase [Acinetobacter sp. S55]MBK0068037.1 uroporphyrinogen-III synthase [Acinetobacter sp. S54]
MLFINTRPTVRAEQLNQSLQAKGYEVIDYPLLELIESPYSDELVRLYQQLAQTQVVVVVSPTAAEIGLRYLHRSGIDIQQLKHIQWVAVGKSTADYLARYQLNAEVPAIETSEGMLQLEMFKQPSRLKQIAFWRGEGGRQFMMQHLASQGIEVLNFVLYSRHCPLETVEYLPILTSRILAEQEKVWVLMSSEASWLNWLKLVEALPSVCHRCCYMVLGERLFHILMTYKNQQNAYYSVCRVDDLKPNTVLAQLEKDEGRL